MTEAEFKKGIKKGEIEEIKEEEEREEFGFKKTIPPPTPTFEDYMSFLEELRVIRRAEGSAPTTTPKSFAQQFFSYESSGTYRAYLYIKDAWKKIWDSTWGFLTSTQVTDLTDGGASTLHKHDHGGQDGLLDNDHTQYLQNLVEDTTPQLGGDLDLNGKNIDFPTTPNISDVLDEDNMSSDSATKLATQQSIKKYVDDNAGDDFGVGDLLYASADTERDEARYDGLWYKHKEISIFKAGTLRIKFDAKRVGTSSGASVAVFRNGVKVGTDAVLTDTYQTFSEDISGWSADDNVQLYLKATGVPSDTMAFAKNFRIYVDHYDGYNVDTD